MCSRPHVVRLLCTSCLSEVDTTDILVYYDSTGREGPATEPSHLRCYLNIADPTLSANRALNDYVAEQAASIIRDYYKNL
jgi:hypothetical protein